MIFAILAQKHLKYLKYIVKLPVDIIQNVSLYINEKDIFIFERCCRLFYQIINNSSYLRQCNDFKEFRLTDKRLDEMITNESKYSYSYCKYSQLNTLIIGLINSSVTLRDDKDIRLENQRKLKEKWEQKRLLLILVMMID